MKNRILTTQLGHEIKFSELGFGTAPLGNMHKVLSDSDCKATVECAYNSGVTYFDTAPQYGHGLSETRLGAVLKQQPRESFLLSTKIGRLLKPCETGQADTGIFVDVPNMEIVFDYSYDGVMRSFEESLSRLNIDSIDILYIHDVDIFTHGLEGSKKRISEVMTGGYHAMDELRKAGKIKAIGAGVNNWETCQQLTELGQFDCFLLAGRYTLLEQKALNTFLPICERDGIGIILGGPYNSGILATGPVPGAKYDYQDAPQNIMDQVKKIEKTCNIHDVSLAVAALHFPLKHPSVVSVIPGGQTVDEVKRNRAMMDVQVPDALWADLKSQGLLHPDSP